MSSSITGPEETRNPEYAEIDDEELLARLDDEFELSGLRERRFEELRKEINLNHDMQANNHGRYVEIKDEKELIQLTAKAKMSVVHFFHQDFEKCKIMDQKLEELACKYFTTRFLRVDVANVPWLVSKLEVKVLPCVVGFVDGISKERIIGFEGISSTTQPSKQIDISKLESRLKQAGVIEEDEKTKKMVGGKSNQASRIPSNGIRQTSDNDLDWDD